MDLMVLIEKEEKVLVMISGNDSSDITRHLLGMQDGNAT
jgi:hypothetical protein